MTDDDYRAVRIAHARGIAGGLTIAPALVVVDVLFLWYFMRTPALGALVGVAGLCWLLLAHVRLVRRLWPGAMLVARASMILAAAKGMTMDDALRLAFEEREGAHEDDEEGDDQ